MNVLIIGSGGRESCFAWKLAQSPLLANLYLAPGNPGTAKYGKNVDIAVDNFEQLGQLCIENNITLVLVGPEVPLVKGIVDFFNSNADLSHISIIGPNKSGAVLEGSKDFSKKFMQKYHIPTAAYQTFDKNNLDAGLQYLENSTAPYVLKADGLAAGKGVIITSDLVEAKATLSEMISDLKFGDASEKVVIEQFLSGIELSVFALCDGKNYVILPEAKDYKRIGEADSGPNTGGMGAISPVPFATKEFMQKVEQKIIIPTIEGLKNEGIDYKGFIFFGLINVENEPWLIEYNCRMGDPETEAVLPRLKSDLLEILSHVKSQNLQKTSIIFENFTTTTLMLVAQGYPNEYLKGDIISGIENTKDVLCFHAGTKNDALGNVVTNGGRVMAISASADTLKLALQKANATAEIITWKGKNYRKDIGFEFL